MKNGKVYSVIAGTGSYIPDKAIPNNSFLHNEFYDLNGESYAKSNDQIIDDFGKITDIAERRYIGDDLVASDIALFAAEEALEVSGIDGEELDYIIVAHNFGDLKAENKVLDSCPPLASRVKQSLGIENPDTIAYDILFGCPGWVQGLIQADYFFKSGDAKRALVIGVETLSRISDPHDRDSMIYSDGAGAAVLEARESDVPVGLLAHAVRSDSLKQAYLLSMGKSNCQDCGSNELYLKMDGRAVYEYALTTVPLVVKQCIDKAGVSIKDIKKFLFHQANAKMIEAILKRTGKQFGVNNLAPTVVLPMTISWLGNSSVATIPTILDLLFKGKLEEHKSNSGDIHVLASVGAGMNVN